MANGNGSTTRQLKRSWQEINDYANDATNGDAFDQTVSNVLDKTRQLACSLVKNNPGQLIENPANTALTNFWGSALRCDLSEEEKPKPPSGEGREESCLAFTGGQQKGTQYVITVKVEWVQNDNNSGESSRGSDEAVIGDADSGPSVIFGKIDSVCIETNSGTTWGANVIVKGESNLGSDQEADGNLFNAATGDSYQISIGSPYSDDDAPLNDPDFERIITDWSVSLTKRDSGEEDDEGEPEEDSDEPPKWDAPDPDVDTDIDVEIPKPDGYPDWYPDQGIKVKYNPDNKTFEGEGFKVKFGRDGGAIEFDGFNPPNWISDGLETIGDAADVLSDLAPPPFDDILDVLGDLLSDEEEGEGEEPQDFTFTVESCVEGEIEEEQITLSLLPSQEAVVGQIIEVRNRVERGRCSLVAFEAVKITVSKDTVRGQARFGDTEQQTRKFFGWLQFLRDGEMIGDEVLIRYDPQIIPYHPRADDYLIQTIDGAELEDEVISLD